MNSWLSLFTQLEEVSWMPFEASQETNLQKITCFDTNFLESEADTRQGTQIIVTESEHCHQHCCKLNCLIMSDCIRETTPLHVLTCSPVRQGWRSPGFVVSRASTLSSTSSDNSPSSSSPSVDSRCSSPLPGEPAGPPHPGSHDDPRPQSAR